jgi:hypothetical protein
VIALQAAPSISELTTIEYNRMLVEEEHKRQAEERKNKHDAEREYRKQQEDLYRQIGNEHAREYKEQMSAAKEEVQRFQNSNMYKGSTVKAEVESLRSALKSQKEEWMEHGSTLAQELGSDQKKRIKGARGATSTRKRESAGALKKELTELEKMRTERQQQAVENRRQLREKIQAQTSDGAVAESKALFFEQRKATGDDTRTQMKDWKADKQRQQGQYLDKAGAARAEAIAAQKAAKASLDDIKAKKARDAKEMRDRKANMMKSGGAIGEEIKHNKKVVHDMMRKQKFVGNAPQSALMKSRSPGRDAATPA